MWNRITNLFSSKPPAANPGAAPAQPASSQIYYRNDKNWVCFNIPKLSEKQCVEANLICREESDTQRNRAIAKAVGGAVVAVGVVLAAIVIAKFAALFFALALGKVGELAAINFSEATYLTVKVLAHAATYLTAGWSLYKLWDATHSSVQNHWDYATHLYDQGVNALMAKAGRAAPAAPVQPQPPQQP